MKKWPIYDDHTIEVLKKYYSIEDNGGELLRYIRIYGIKNDDSDYSYE